MAVVAPRALDLGKLDILLDGVRVRTIDLGATSVSAPRSIVWSSTWAASGPHSVAIVVRGTAGRPAVDLDAFLILR